MPGCVERRVAGERERIRRSPFCRESRIPFGETRDRLSGGESDRLFSTFAPVMKSSRSCALRSVLDSSSRIACVRAVR